MIFGILALIVCGLVGAFVLGRVTSVHTEAPLANIALASLPPPTPAPVIHQMYTARRAVPALVPYNPDYVAPRVTVTAPTLPRPAALVYTPSPVVNVPPPAPVDYAARDRQIHDLQSRIDAIDAQILQFRNHPSSHPFLLSGTYNGRGHNDGEESSFKKYLDDLDKQRNDLRREKWRLEGR